VPELLALLYKPKEEMLGEKEELELWSRQERLTSEIKKKLTEIL
jgi:hypothetical protein